LAFTLQRLFLDFAPEQTLTKAHYDAMSGIEGSIDRKLAEAKAKAGTAGTDANLRRLIVPALATWDAAASAAKRLVPNETDVIAGDRAGLAPLADALVEARLLTRGGGTLEVAHEALLRRQPISGWLEQQKDTLKLRDDVLREAKEWADAGKPGQDLPRRGARLESALALQKHGDFASALAPAKDYLAACRRLENAGRRKARWAQAAIFTLLLAVIGGLLARMYERELRSFAYWHVIMGPSVLTAEQEKEKAAKPGSDFKECATGCPTMVVVPAGKFMMGSPESEEGHDDREAPQHEVTIAKPFAVGRTEVTFAEWDACVAAGACVQAPDSTWGRDDRPVINVSWDDAKQYVDWLSRITGKGYRLLSEAEWEYAARAGTTTAYSWGDDIGKGNANCNGCDSEWDAKQPAPVGSFKSNAFGLYDMHGNVFEWVEDTWHVNYEGAPVHGTAWLQGMDHVIRGGSWDITPQYLRAASRFRTSTLVQVNFLGFPLARTLNP
jgi:formylglycine-generating enzyme required for sulfatase activity